MNNKMNGKEGTLTLEACLSLTLFMFLILFLYSFFTVFEAQTKIHHTLIQAAESMSLDAPATDKLNKNMEELSDLYDIAGKIGFNISNVNPEFVSPHPWYRNSTGIEAAAEERFIAYFTDGNREKADEVLKSLRVTEGISGLDFSSCKIDQEGNINLSVTYSVEFLFDYKGFNLDPFEFTSTTISRIWEKGE